MMASAVGLATQAYAVVRTAVLLGLWCFIVPVYVVVAHRMIPFFSASAVPSLDAWRPNWLLWTLLGMVLVQGAWVWLEARGLPTPSWLWRVRFGTALVSGVLILALAVRWGLWRSLRDHVAHLDHVPLVHGHALHLSGELGGDLDALYVQTTVAGDDLGSSFFGAEDAPGGPGTGDCERGHHCAQDEAAVGMERELHGSHFDGSVTR